MKEIEGTTYYSKEEINSAQLDFLISFSITDNSNNHSKKASLYFDSTIRIESVASNPKYKNGFINLKGIFNVTLENIDSFNDEYLLFHFTEHSFINDKKVSDKTPIKIKPREIIFNYINFPKVYSKMLININKVTRFYTFLPRYFTKNDIKEILKVSRYTKKNPNNLIKEVDSFTLEKEIEPAHKNWYETVSRNSEYCYINDFENEPFITLELLKDNLNESNFLKIINLAESRLIRLYLHIDTKGRFFNFETKSKHFKLINNQFNIKGFLTFKKLTKTKIEFQSNQFCFIKDIVPNEIPFCFSTFEFENLVKFIDIKNNNKIEQTYIDIKDSIINDSMLHTQDVYIYFNLNELAMLCGEIDIDLKEENILNHYKSRKALHSQQTNKTQSKKTITKTPNQIQDIIDYIITFKSNDKRKSNNRIIILSALQKHFEQYPHKNDIPEFDELYNFIKKKGDEIDLIHEVEPKKLLLVGVKHITKKAFKTSFDRLLELYQSNVDH